MATSVIPLDEKQTGCLTEMLQYTYTTEFISFSFVNHGQVESLHDIEQKSQGETFAQWVVLKELLDNAQAEREGESIRVPWPDMVRLTEYDRILLKLPPPYPFEIVIQSKGMLHQPDFQFNWGFYEYEQGRQLFATRIGCILKLEESKEYLLSEKQYELCQALDEFALRTPNQTSSSENWIRFADIKQHAVDAAAVLDRYLSNESVVVPNLIHLRVDKIDDDTIELNPEIDGIDNQQYSDKVHRFPNIRDVYNIEDENGHRTRIVHTEKQKQALQQIKEHRRVSGEEKEKLLSHPQEIFDPAVIDLDAFSKRVKEIGIYKPRVYPFITPYKTQWIPGICADGKRVTIKTHDELNEFKEAVRQAQQKNHPHVHWKNIDIPIHETDKIIRVVEKQLHKPDKPIDGTGDGTNELKCLIIYENIEELEYSLQSTGIKAEQLTLYPVPNLKPEVQLLPHQKEGIAWLQSLEGKVPGVLLADDMGLGKTLQVLSFLNWIHVNHNPNQNPFLIVAPVSLIENWEREYHTFFDHFSEWTVVHSDYFRLLNTRTGRCGDESPFRKNHIYITNYELLRRHGHLFGPVNWRVVVLDEAQKIKTPGTLITNAAKALKSGFSIAVTGTPVENTLVDIWCIMDFAYPGLLNSAKEFAKEFQNPLKRQDTDIQELGERLRKRIGICLRRKTKKDTLNELPPIYKESYKKNMPDIQKQRYLAEQQRARESIDRMHEQRGIMLSVLHNLRDISDHPFLPDRRIDQYSANELIEVSAKLQATCKILEDIKSRGEKVLLYADRKETQKMLVKILKDQFGLRTAIINGETPAVANIGRAKKTRQSIIDDFQNSPGFQALVLSPLAAGFGFNITGANHVIHYSRHWNPAKEQQATDRVYRIGQTKDVFIYYPMAVSSEFDTFDILLDRLLERKMELASASLFPTEQMEIRPDDLFESVVGKETGYQPPPEPFLTIQDIDSLTPFLFEAAIAVLWRKSTQGQVILTPKTNDKGADIVILNPVGNYLFQVKQTNTHLGDSAIGEILKAEGYYALRYQTAFQLGVITNQDFNTNTKALAKQNNVELYTRTDLIRILQDVKLIMSEIYKMENQRMQ